MRIALGLAYDGSFDAGWQRQSHRSSLQAHVEHALSQVAAVSIEVLCAGRTDKGVHATAQVIHFDTTVVRESLAWLAGTNHYLPNYIKVHWAKQTSDDFHARFKATYRRYWYCLQVSATPFAFFPQGITRWPHVLDVESMQAALPYLLGTQDFSAFRDKQCQAKSPIKTIEHCRLICQHDWIILDIKADAFLHHMVRNIMGALLAIGEQRYPPVWLAQVIASRDRRAAWITAPPNGLYLVDVGYAEQWQLPQSLQLPWFLSSLGVNSAERLLPD